MITIKTIPHKQHRYETVGDWWWTKDGDLEIRVSQMSDWRYEACVAVHELVEVLLCKHADVSQESVDEFDIEFEKQRKRSLTLSTAEPGDSRFAPYRTQHCIATGAERVLAAVLGVNWSDYETEINSL
jgi:hypothetical protein